MKRVTHIVFALAALFALLRFAALDTDPPLYMVGHGQALLTDPYHLTHHARSKALFDDWRPYGNERWDTFKNSLVSGTSYLMFSVAGVSRGAANLAAVTLSLGGLALLALAIYRRRGAREAAVAAVFLAINSTLFFYGRYPFLENGLIFLSGALCYLIAVHGRSAFAQLGAGAALALAALAGKLFGALLVAPLAAALVYEHRRRALKPALRVAAGAVVGGAAYLFICYGADLSQALAYYTEHTVGMYGTPPGFRSPLAFIQMALTYGGESGLIEYIPLFFLTAGVSLTALPLLLPHRLRYDPSFAPVLFCLVWALAGIAGLSPFYYRPLRYGLFLLAPLSALIAAALVGVADTRSTLKPFHPWLAPLGVFFVLWWLVTQGVMYFADAGQVFASGASSLGGGAVVAALGAAAFWWLCCRSRRRIPRRAFAVPLAALALASVTHDSVNLYRGLAQPGKHLKYYNQAIAEILPETAVLTGPYAPALTIDNQLGSVIYMFGLADLEPDLFEKYPITHMVIDKSNYDKAQGLYAELAGARFLAALVIREQAVHLYRVTDSAVPLTTYERGMAFLTAGARDSARASFAAALREHPDNLFAWMNLISSELSLGQQDSALAELERLTKRHADNYLAQGYALGIYSRLAQETGDAAFRSAVTELRNRVAKLNPSMPRAQ
ncbi:MAG TPA: tetratricopeptide repeat protein [candidate division Zixibacteria bacterium]|nr:tetratricopeptide repeat protein [candidate division Zixibacteria bacterium]